MKKTDDTKTNLQLIQELLFPLLENTELFRDISRTRPQSYPLHLELFEFDFHFVPSCDCDLGLLLPVPFRLRRSGDP